MKNRPHYLMVPKLELFATEAAVMLGCNVQKVYMLLKSGALEGYKEGKAWKISVDELYRYADRVHIPLNTDEPDEYTRARKDD